MLTKFGENTETLFLKGLEAHKLHHEFTVAATATAGVRKGQPVVLNSAGEVLPAATGAKAQTIIGYSIHNGKAGELVTIGMKAYGIIYCKPNAAVAAGPVQYAGQNTAEPEYPAVAAAAADGTTLMGWALDEAEAANDMIRLALY